MSAPILLMTSGTSTPSSKLSETFPEVQYIPDFISKAEEEYLVQKVDQIGGDLGVEMEMQENIGEEYKETRRKGGLPGGWKDVKGRRSMYWGGTLTQSNTLISKPLPPFMTQSFPNVATRVANTGRFDKAKGGKPNHVLVNEYLPGQGIMPHQDGPAYFPTVATLSLGSHAILEVFEYEDVSPDIPPPTSTTSGSSPEQQTGTSGGRKINPTPVIKILLEPRSLFVLSGPAYTSHLHGIRPREFDSWKELSEVGNWDSLSEEGRFWINQGMEMSRGGEGNGGGTRRDGVGGWQRLRRVSLTMRCVEKVKKLII